MKIILLSTGLGIAIALFGIALLAFFQGSRLSPLEQTAPELSTKKAPLARPGVRGLEPSAPGSPAQTLPPPAWNRTTATVATPSSAIANPSRSSDLPLSSPAGQAPLSSTTNPASPVAQNTRQPAQQTFAATSSFADELVVSDGVRLPAALADSSAGAADAQALDRIANEFIDQLKPEPTVTGNQSGVSNQSWEKARAAADERYRAMKGFQQADRTERAAAIDAIQ